MPIYTAFPSVRAGVSGRHIISRRRAESNQSSSVATEPLCSRGLGTRTLQRRHFVIARAFPTSKCVAGIRADMFRQNIEAPGIFCSRREPVSWNQFVVGVKRRSMTTAATFSFKYFPAL